MSDSHVAVAKLLFPFDFKTGQEACLEQLTVHPFNLWQAQTGFGKTLLSLCATLPYLLDPVQPISRIVVFVRTKTQIFRFFEDVKTIAERYLAKQLDIHSLLNCNPYFSLLDPANPFFAIPLVSKSDLCIHTSTITSTRVNCKEFLCPLFTHQELSAHDRARVKKFFFASVPLSSQDIIAGCQTLFNGSKCPYYTMRSFIPSAPLVVTTQAWLYGPLRTKIEDWFFSSSDQTAIIVDETHNLKAFSVKKLPREFLTAFMTDQKLLTLRLELTRAFFSEVQPDRNGGFAPPANLAKLQTVIADLLPQLKRTKDPDYVRVRTLQEFLHEPGSIWFTEKFKKELGHINVAPTTIRGNFLKVRKIILMSGTIYPPQIYALLFQLARFNIIALKAQQRLVYKAVFRTPSFSAKLTNRSPKLYHYIAFTIRKLHLLNTKGHTFVFNPSNDFKLHIFESLTNLDPDHQLTLRMEQDSKYNQRLIDELKTQPNALVLATLNGSFSEGIEVKDPVTKKSKINLIIITGMPLQPPSLENYFLDGYFLKKYGLKIADFMRNFLPINQILTQTVGRGVRGEQDSCWVVCTDHRIMRYNIWDEYGVVKNEHDLDLLCHDLTRYFDHVY